MKAALSSFNNFMVGFPAVMALFGWLFFEGLWLLALLFTIITGAFQVIVGLTLFLKSNGRNIYCGIYLTIVIIFFFLWHMTDWEWIFVMPPLLALYMSILLYVEAKKENYES